MRTPIPSGANWAKLSPHVGTPELWHPLADHCFDVAACVESLLALPIVRARIAALAGADAIPDIWATRLAALSFLHDFGKANCEFQRRALDPSGRGGHVAEAATCSTKRFVATPPDLARSTIGETMARKRC